MAAKKQKKKSSPVRLKKKVRKVGKAAKAPAPKKIQKIKPQKTQATAQKPLGRVTHFYDKIRVAVVALNGELKTGDKIKIGKEENFFEQEVKSMQIEHEKIEKARKGQEIGLKVKSDVREGFLVFKV